MSRQGHDACTRQAVTPRYGQPFDAAPEWEPFSEVGEADRIVELKEGIPSDAGRWPHRRDLRSIGKPISWETPGGSRTGGRAGRLCRPK